MRGIWGGVSQKRGNLRVGCFWAGWSVLVLALVSPLHSWGTVLFSAHMVQHELLMLIAAPLLVLARPMPTLLRGMPKQWLRVWARRVAGVQRRCRGWVESALLAWVVHAALLWGWHHRVLFSGHWLVR
jgi:cytochrome c oxidase assembly factor CtaG